MFNAVDWDKEFGNKNIEESYDLFLEIYTKARDACVPNKLVVDLEKFRKPPWMKQSTVQAIKRKHSTWRKYLYTKHPSNRKRYRSARNQEVHRATQDRKCFERGLAANMKKKH